MKKHLSILSLCAALSGCAYDNEVTGQHGEIIAHKLTCGTLMPEVCTSKAKEICPSGYTILETESGTAWGGQMRMIRVKCK